MIASENALLAGAELVESPPLAAPEQMALDELLLEAAPKDGPAFRFFRWSGPAVTFGYSQGFAEACAAAAARGLEGNAIVRRPTGGGVVFHDGDVTFSAVFRWPEATAPQAIYKDLHRAVHLALKVAGMPTRLFSPPQASDNGGIALACFPNPVAIDLVLEDGRKVLGGALRKRKGFGLYQGSLRPEGLGEPAAIRDALTRGLFEGRPAGRSWGEDRLEQTRRLAERRYRSSEWNHRR